MALGGDDSLAFILFTHLHIIRQRLHVSSFGSLSSFQLFGFSALLLCIIWQTQSSNRRSHTETCSGKFNIANGKFAQITLKLKLIYLIFI